MHLAVHIMVEVTVFYAPLKIEVTSEAQVKTSLM